MSLLIRGGKPLLGEVELPADKSLMHRALFCAALAEKDQVSKITAKVVGQDNLTTVQVLRAIGVPISEQGADYYVSGLGNAWPTEINTVLDCGNSGTTMRLLAGILAGKGVKAQLVGDASLMRRPMGRICKPLRRFGAHVYGTLGSTLGDRGETPRRAHGSRSETAGGLAADVLTNEEDLQALEAYWQEQEEYPPLYIHPSKLFEGGVHKLAVASAQVKSALLFAGLGSKKRVEILEPILSRDHTERMLLALGAFIKREYTPEGHKVILEPSPDLNAEDFRVPGDFSAAAFLITAALLLPGSRIVLKNVGLNPTRIGFLQYLAQAKAQIQISEERTFAGEPTATLTIEYTPLALKPESAAGFLLPRDLIPTMIDELPILAVLASGLEGQTTVREAGELKVKESDRLAELERLFTAFGLQINIAPDGFTVKGRQSSRAAVVDVASDHRVALTAAVLALISPGESVLEGSTIAAISYPNFISTLKHLGAEIITA